MEPINFTTLLFLKIQSSLQTQLRFGPPVEQTTAYDQLSDEKKCRCRTPT